VTTKLQDVDYPIDVERRMNRRGITRDGVRHVIQNGHTQLDLVGGLQERTGTWQGRELVITIDLNFNQPRLISARIR
jgi:hypothetical protein